MGGGGKVRYTLTIDNGETTSNALEFNQLRFASDAVIYAPDTLPETVTVEVTDVRDGSDGWVEMTDEAGDPVQPAAGEAIPIPDINAMGLRLVSGSSVAADREFGVVLGEVG